jgi:ferredoxin-NADP reductase
MKITYSHSKEEAANITSFFFKPEHRLDYTAGQYAEFFLQHNLPDSRGMKRWFTLSSSPNDELISITTKFSSESSSFKKALLKLKPNAMLNFTGPMGDFVLPKLIQTPIVFVAAGIGITPYHSMLMWLTETNETRPIRLLYAVKSEEEIIFQETFDKANQHATIVVQNPSESWGGERGNINAELITGLADPSDNTLIYISGPEELVEKLNVDLRRTGLAKHQLVSDFFHNYSGL